jgi:hypothetical protein
MAVVLMAIPMFPRLVDQAIQRAGNPLYSQGLTPRLPGRLRSTPASIRRLRIA